MILKTLKLENFAGVSDLTIDFDSTSTFIYGDNGTGETTVFNAFTWLLTGKASTGAANFTPKTEGTHGLDHSVFASLILAGGEVTLKKTFHEVYKKKRGAAKEEFAGHATDYYIDGVLTKEKDFTRFIEEHIGTPDIIKELSLPEYFSEGESWQNRRQTLLNICGDVTDDDVIASDLELSELLPEILNGRSVDDYIKIVTAEMKDLNKQIDAIPTRIDEANKAIPEITIPNTRKDLTAERTCLVTERDKLKADYSEATHGSVAYNQKLFKLRSELQQANIDYMHHIQHAVSVASAQIVNLQAGFFIDHLQSLDVTERQVYNMDIIADAGAVVCIIIVAKHTQLRPFADCNLRHIGHQIVGNAVGILADQAALVRTDRIKIPQKNHIPRRICFLHIRHDLFQHGFCPSVRIGTGSLWTFFRNRNKCRITIYSCRRRENNIFTIMFSHYIYQSQCTRNIVFIIFPWFCNRFPYCF